MAVRKTTPKKTTTRRRAPRAKHELSVWEKIVELGKEIPPQELARWPKDGSLNTDHYLDGSPKQYP